MTTTTHDGGGTTPAVYPYATYAHAEAALADSIADVVADHGEVAADAAYADTVRAVAAYCSPDVAAELCRRKLGQA